MVIVVIGPMGCGKTTVGSLLGTMLGWRFDDGDDFHPAENVEKMRSGLALDDDDRHGWLSALRNHIENHLARAEPLVLACSALKQSYRDLLGIDQERVVSVYLKGTVDLLRERLSGRHHRYMNDALLTSQVETMEEPEDGLTIDIDRPPEQICAEIITTLALETTPP